MNSEWSWFICQNTGCGFLLNSMFDFAERLNELQLTDEEIALFSALVIISAGIYCTPAYTAHLLLHHYHYHYHYYTRLTAFFPGQPG